MNKILQGLITLLTIITISTITLTAAGNKAANQNLLKVGIVSGKVTDNDSKKPIPYANILIKSQKDSNTVTGGMTDAKGMFEIKNIPLGRYFAEVKFIGYERHLIDGIHLSGTHPSKNLKNISLTVGGVMTEEIVVEADRLAVDYQLDKKVVNVAQNLDATGGTAVEALENIPSVEVDIEGNVALRGSSNFTVFVNGKPSILSGTEALEAIPAETIDKIEIITNPSAKYDPEGMAGIMNIILKKNIKRGFNGLVNAGLGKNGSYNGDFLFNYFSGGLTFFAGADYRKRRFDMTYDSYQEIYADTNVYITNDRDMERGRDGYSGRVGIGYNFTEKTSFTLEANAGSRGHMRNNYSDVSYQEGLDGQVIGIPQYTYNEEIGERNSGYWGMNGSFLQLFDTPGQKLSANFSYSLRDGEEPGTQSEYTTDETYSIDGVAPDKKIRTSEDTDDSQRILVNLDYTHPFTEKSNFESGYQYKYNENNEIYDYEDWNYQTEEWNWVDEFSNTLDYTEIIHSGYFTFASAIGKDSRFKYMLGLRGEYTDRETGMKADSTFKIDRFDLFPTLHTSFNINKNNQIAASYSRRIDRPRGWFLEPYITYIDEYNRRIGNPELEPEYSDSYEINYQYAFAKGSYFSMEAYHRHRMNMITRFRDYDPETNLTYHTFQNVNDDYSTGVELMLNYIPVKWLTVNLSGTVYNYQIEADNSGQLISRDDNTYRGRFNLTFKPIKTTRLQLSGDYRAASVTAQGESEASYGFNFAARQDLLNGAFSLTFNIRDIFGTHNWESTIYDSDSYIKSRFHRDSPYYSLSLSYRINNYKPDRKQQGGESFDEGGDDF